MLIGSIFIEGKNTIIQLFFITKSIIKNSENNSSKNARFAHINIHKNYPEKQAGNFKSPLRGPY
jgi:hypothetical protein